VSSSGFLSHNRQLGLRLKRIRRCGALSRVAAASCLHPNITVHSPLVFDIVDTWPGHAIGGCTYHVTHPGGRE